MKEILFKTRMFLKCLPALPRVVRVVETRKTWRPQKSGSQLYLLKRHRACANEHCVCRRKPSGQQVLSALNIHRRLPVQRKENIREQRTLVREKGQLR